VGLVPLCAGGSLVDLEREASVVARIAAEAAGAAIEGFAGVLPIELLVSWLWVCTERAVGIPDFVLEAVACYLVDALLPQLA
jgi:hypothetical protein